MEKVEGLDVNPSVLLTWHEKVCLPFKKVGIPKRMAETFSFDFHLNFVFQRQLTEIAGVGAIVRVMTDRRTI